MNDSPHRTYRVCRCEGSDCGARNGKSEQTAFVPLSDMTEENRAVYLAHLTAVTARIQAELRRLKAPGFGSRKCGRPKGRVTAACDWCGVAKSMSRSQLDQYRRRNSSGKYHCSLVCSRAARRAKKGG